MSESKRGTRRNQRPSGSESTQVEQGASTQEQPAFSEFPIRFQDAYLYNLYVSRSPENETKLLSSGELLTTSSAAVNINVLQPRIDLQLMQVGVAVSAFVPTQEAPAWSIEATMNGVFVITEGTDSALVQAFAQSSALPLIWPYLREVFQDLSIRMRIPVIVLPTLDLRPSAPTT